MKLIKIILFLSIIAVILYPLRTSISFLKNCPYFSINKIVITGNSHLKKQDILNQAKIDLGENIFNINLSTINECLKRQAWVKEAMAKRDLPDTVMLEVIERKPCACVEYDNCLYLIDSEGYIIESLAEKKSDYPLIKIPVSKDYKKGNYFDRELIESGLHVINILKSLSEDYLNSKTNNFKIDNLIVNSKTDIIIKTSENILIKIKEDKLSRQIIRLQGLWEDIKTRMDSINYIDLRFDNKVIIKS